MSPRLLHYSDLENAYDTPERIGRVAGLLAARRGPNTLVAGSGDNTSPGVLSLVTEGRQSLNFFEAVSPHVETVGNHDLDHGDDALVDLVADAPQQWVLANVTLDGGQFGASAGIEPRTTVALPDATVGVVGVLDPRTPEMTPGTGHLAFDDPVAAIERECARFREAGAGTRPDYVVALAHVTGEDAERIARETPVDAVLAGHSHEQTAAVIDGTPLTRPGATGSVVYELDLDAGEITPHETATVEPDEGVVGALRQRLRDSGLDEVVARIDDPLSREHEARIAGEWRLGNFVADAYRWKTGADVGLQNGGGIREGPPLAGEVTAADLVSCSPFDEPVVVAEVSGAQLRALAHEADGRLVRAIPDRWWGHVSGMRIEQSDGDGEASDDGHGPTDDRGNEAGDEQAADGSTLDIYEVTVDGDPVEPGETYTVAMPAYLLKTDREFPTVDATHRIDRTAPQYEVLVEYARERGIEVELEGRVPGTAATGGVRGPGSQGGRRNRGDGDDPSAEGT